MPTEWLEKRTWRRTSRRKRSCGPTRDSTSFAATRRSPRGYTRLRSLWSSTASGRVEPRRDRRDAGGGRRHFEGTPLTGSGEGYLRRYGAAQECPVLGWAVWGHRRGRARGAARAGLVLARAEQGSPCGRVPLEPDPRPGCEPAVRALPSWLQRPRFTVATLAAPLGACGQLARASPYKSVAKKGKHLFCRLAFTVVGGYLPGVS